MKKEYVVSKKCDQKDKNFKEYQFIRELNVDEDGFPLVEELDELIKDDIPEKNIALFIGDNYITMFSYKNDRKFAHKVINEYNAGMKNELYGKFYLSSNEKVMAVISEQIEYLKSHSVKIVGKSNEAKGIKYVRSK